MALPAEAHFGPREVVARLLAEGTSVVNGDRKGESPPGTRSTSP